jgi:hypothetical protein
MKNFPKEEVKPKIKKIIPVSLRYSNCKTALIYYQKNIFSKNYHKTKIMMFSTKQKTFCLCSSLQSFQGFIALPNPCTPEKLHLDKTLDQLIAVTRLTY